MNTILKYVIGLDLLNCHAKCRSDTISRSLENEFEVATFGNFPENFELQLSLSPCNMGGRM